MGMKLCIIGKYPPIEGGVSTVTYWLARGLAERGHEIHVVTNADEVEERYRLHLDEEDREWYEPKFPNVQGRVHVHNVQIFDRLKMHHIPSANPFVSKIAGLATETIRRYDCKIIIAFYFEPYAISGWLASRWTGRPLVVKHAGSDLDRLFRVPNLATAYKEVLRSASAVITRRPLKSRFWGLGVHPNRVLEDVPYSVPTKVFHPSAEPLDTRRLSRLALSNAESLSQSESRFDRKVPTIGCYGKIGKAKGTFDLIAALGQLANEGCEFQFLAMIGTAQAQVLAPILREAGLSEKSCLLPFLPNWRVPSFIRTCTAVCFLERDFPIAIHGPIVPREILACGTCLILSREIASKNQYHGPLNSGENMIIVEDPKVHNDLASALRDAISDAERTEAIGKRGLYLSRSIEDFEGYVVGVEELLQRFAGHDSSNSRTLSAAVETSSTTEATLQLIIPQVFSLLRERYPSVVNDFIHSDETCLFATAVSFCGFVADRISRDEANSKLPQILTLLRYTKAHLTSSYDPVGENIPAYAASDCLVGGTVSEELVWNLRPIHGNFVRVEEFDYDVRELAPTFLHPPQTKSAAELLGELASLHEKRMLVLFHRSVNLTTHELQINDLTYILIAMCDGARSTCKVIEEMCERLSVESSAHREEVKLQVLAALERLYQIGVIIFAEQIAGREASWELTGPQAALCDKR
jgi:glycosyltransferase involved in cell wall biosynthesis